MISYNWAQGTVERGWGPGWNPVGLHKGEVQLIIILDRCVFAFIFIIMAVLDVSRKAAWRDTFGEQVGI